MSGFAALAQTKLEPPSVENPAGTFVSPTSDIDTVNLKNQNFLQNFLHDEGSIWTSPLHMNGEQAELWGGVATTTVLAMTVDKSVSRDALRFRDEHVWVQTVSPIATQLGQFYVPYGIAAFSCLDGLAFNNDEQLDSGLLEVQAMVHAGIVVQVMKHLFGRSRPFVDVGKNVWYGPRAILLRYYHGGFSPYDSFPSGHTITAFSLAEVISEREQPWVGIVAYGCAGLCGLSRLTQNDHWLSDVVAGGALGVAIGKFEVDTHQSHCSVSPTVGLRSAGISLQFN